ncbi:MAG: carboxymuconolactone decarboxylase family protein [Ferrimicrobium sp.]
MDHEHGVETHPWHDVQSELRGPVRELRSAIPGTWRAYADLHKESMAPGALSVAMKEVVALSVAVATRCDGCIASHARSAARAGARDEEVAEALGVVVLLIGGPGTVYGPRAFAAFKEFQRDYETGQTPGS